MTSNPYSSPVAVDSESKAAADRAQGCGAEIAWLLIPPMIGAVVGFAWYVIAATMVELCVMPSVEPYKYPYGGPAIFLCLPLSTFYGLLTGFAISVFGSRERKYGGVALLFVAAITTITTVYWWNEFENAAECSSKYVLFYPLFTFSILIGTVGLVFASKLYSKRNGG